MPYSYAVYTGNGATTQFTVPFPYVRKEHVSVKVNDVGVAFTWVNDSTVQVTPAPANGLEVFVKRTTPVASRLVDYTDGSTLVAADLDTDSLQHLYTEQELTDSVGNLEPFRGLYYGALASDPTLDPFGRPPSEGDLYFSTVSRVLRMYVGTGWEDATPNVTVLRWVKTAAGGETSLSGNDDNSQTLLYNAGLELVYLNGALLTRGVDYVATTGSSITGLVALAAADLVEVVAFSRINAIDSIPGANIVDGTITTAKLADSSVTSGKIADDTIVNADVNASAGIVATKLSFTQTGTNAIAQTIDNKLKKTVHVTDYGIGGGVADDAAKIQTLLDEVSAGGGGEIIFDSDNNYLVSDCIFIPSNLVIRFTGAGFITLTQSSTAGGVFIVYGTETVPAENITIYNPKVDAADFGHPTSAVYGENGIGGSNCINVQVYGGTIKNCRRGTSNPVGTGGKGVQFENGVENILVHGTTILNCTIAVETGGAPDAIGPVQFRRFRNVQYKDIRVFDCERVVSVVQSFSPPNVTGDVGMVQIDGVLAFNCGREAVAGTEKNFGAIVLDRASNVSITNFTLANTSTYGTLGALVRQARGTNCVIQAQFLGDADALVLHDVGSTGWGTTGTCEDNSYQVIHKGAAGYAISGASGQAGALLENFYHMQLDTVSTGLINSVVAFATLYCRFFSEAKSTSIEGLASRIIDANIFSNAFPTQQFGIAATANINGIFFSFGSGTKIIGTEGANLLRLQHSSSNQRIDISTNGVALFGLGTHADNAAAVAAGLAVGQLYRTATGQVMIRF